MSEVPEDVMVAATKAYDDGFERFAGNKIEAIAQAILAEREASAKIAEDLKANPQGIRLAMGELSAQEMRAVKAVLSFVTAAIRRR